MNRARRPELLRRHQGHRGEVIAPHRALITLDLRGSRILLSILMGAGLLIAWVLAIPHVTTFWKGFLEWWLQALDLPGQVGLVRHVITEDYTLITPRLEVGARAFTPTIWWIGTISCVVMLLVSYLLPRHRVLPLIYLLRLVVILQSSAQLFFWVRPESFPYDVGGYTEVLFIAGVFIIGLAPVIYAFTYCTLDFSRKKKLALPLMAMAHLILFLPLQLLSHAVVLHHGSLLLMPMLFWMFGLVLDVAVIIGLFSWAASWKPLLHGRGVWWKPPGGLRVFLGLLLATLLVSDADAQDPVPRGKLLEAGATYGEYDGDLGESNGQFVRFSLTRPWVDTWRFDVGRSERFEDEGLGFGIGYSRNLRRDTVVSAGLSTGTGDVLYPDLRFDLGLDHGLLTADNLIASVGYTRVESKAENSSDGFSAGLRYYTGPWIASVGGRVEIGHPGETTSESLNLGLTWGLYKRLYFGVGAEFGNVSYILVAADEALVDFGSRSWNVGGTWYVRPTWGVGARADFTDTDFYELWSLTLRAFREW